MKKILSVSLIVAMAVGMANAGVTQRQTSISDVVRMMEENPEYIDAAADAIVTARAAKTIGKRFNSTVGKLDNKNIKLTDSSLYKLNPSKITISPDESDNENGNAKQMSIPYDEECKCLLPDTYEQAMWIINNNKTMSLEQDYMGHRKTRERVVKILQEELDRQQKENDAI